MTNANVGSSKAVDDAVSAARTLKDEGVIEHYQQELERYRDDLYETVREKPLTTLAVAAFFGFAIGAIWRS